MDEKVKIHETSNWCQFQGWIPEVSEKLIDHFNLAKVEVTVKSHDDYLVKFVYLGGE
jgi:hypothetical protein